MKTWVVIPARFGSTRFPGKPLVSIAGLPLLQRVIEQVKKSKLADHILVATDHPEIESLCKSLKTSAVQTDSALTSGTDRIYQALVRSKVEIAPNDIVINVQGDEPLIPESWIDGLAQEFQKNPKLEMGTLAHPMTWEEHENLNAVKVICDDKAMALYFSRFPIPHSREKKGPTPAAMKHVGVYAYRFSVLKKFCETSPSALEISESLEQLRALQMGVRIFVMKVAGAIQGVDVPEDVQKVEKILKG